MFNQTRLCIYLCTQEIVLDNGYDFKNNLIPLLTDYKLNRMQDNYKPKILCYYGLGAQIM